MIGLVHMTCACGCGRVGTSHSPRIRKPRAPRGFLCTRCKKTRTEHGSGTCQGCRTITCARCQKVVVSRDPDAKHCAGCWGIITDEKRAL
jgi:hypothetical protein